MFMIPLKDSIKTATFPIITISLIFVNILFYVWMFFFLPYSAREDLYRNLGLIPYEFLLSLTEKNYLLPYNLFTLFSSMFLHGNLFHLLGNMLYLWIFGNNVEDAMGHKRFLLFYFFSGLCAALLQFLYDPFSTVPMIGASGAISGILGAYLLLFPFARVMTLIVIFIFLKIVELPAIFFLTLWFLMQILFSHIEGVAWYAHIGGFIFGILTVKLFKKRRKRRFT